MNRLHNRDILSALMLLALAGFGWFQTASLNAKAAMFPRLALILLAGFSLLYLGRELLKLRVATPPDAPFFTHRGRFLIALALIVVYANSFPHVGFVTSTFVFINLFVILMGMRRYVLTMVSAAIFVAGAQILFVVLLERQLPHDIFLSLFGGY